MIFDEFLWTRFYNPTRNWTLEKMLEDDSFSQFSVSLQDKLYLYKFKRDFPEEAVENAIYSDDHEMVNRVYKDLTYDLSISSTSKVAYVIKDSSILYSDEIKSFLIQKRNEIGILKFRLSDLPMQVHETLEEIDKEIKEL